MSNAVLYAVNGGGATIAVGNAVPFPQIVRRYGNCATINNNTVTLKGAGYYEVNANIIASGAAEATITATLYQNGEAVPGAAATVSVPAANGVVALPISAVVRVTGCPCNETTLTVVITGQAATITNASIDVVKL